MVRPLVTWSVTDRTRLTVGGELYAGPPDSFFGQLEQNRTVVAEYRYFF